MQIRIHIQGQPPRKSNSRKIVRHPRTQKPMIIKSAEARSWVESAGYQIPTSARQQVGSKDQPLAISFWVRYASRRPDLSVELILDTLQEYGVISDDRWVYEMHVYKEIDRDNPGVEILIEECQTGDLCPVSLRS
jgi:Holliday junction resolvase RusA-like endonuclease